MGTLGELISIAGSGLTANRLWMDVISGNIANANTTRTPEGGPFRRQLVIMRAKLEGQEVKGVEVASIERDPTPPRLVYDPGHPDARPDGYVEYPNVNVVMELVDLIAAQRAWEANATVLETAKSIAQRTIGLLGS